MTKPLLLAGLPDLVGTELGVSPWLDCTQGRIQAFAECTEDRQWIHVDVERARAESPFGGTVAHGMLLLSLLPHWTYQVQALPEDTAAVLNYGFDKVRFLAPVPASSRLRARVKLLAAIPKGAGRFLVTLEHTVEIDNGTKPALIAEMLVMLLPQAG